MNKNESYGAYDYTLEVSVEKGEILYDKGGGNFTVSGEGEFIILFKRKPGQTWCFVDFKATAIGDSPVVVRGLPVLHPTVSGEQIRLEDQLFESGRYKYTIEIEHKGATLISDPEIKNVRTGGPRSVTSGL